MDHHLVPQLSLAGMGLDLVGGLFLAYDLFGEQGGPLRVLLRTFLFVLIYSTTLDLKFGLIAGAGLGLTLAFRVG